MLSFNADMNICSTSPPGGNQVDGLPPVINRAEIRTFTSQLGEYYPGVVIGPTGAKRQSGYKRCLFSFFSKFER